MIKDDFTPDGPEGFCTFGIPDFQRRIQNVQHTFRAGHGLLHILQQVGQAGHRPVEQTQVKQECHDVRYAQPFPVSKVTAEADDQDCSQGRDKFDGRMEDRADFQCPEHGADVFEIPFVDLLGFIFLPAEGLNLMDTGKVVLQFAVQFPHLFLGDPEERANLL